MKTIELTRGQASTVDDEDFDQLIRHKWQAKWAEHTQSFYAQRRGGMTIHRQVMGCSKHDGRIIDHINGDTLDNRKANLRDATSFQNARNARVRKDNISGFKGVAYHKATNKWQVSIRRDNKQTYLGLYTDLEQAKEVYNKAAKELFGAFAYLN